MLAPRRRYEAKIVRTALTVLVLLTCMRVWFGPLPIEPTAAAQQPNAGLQRLAQIEQVKQTNTHLEAILGMLSEIKATLDSGTIKIQIAEPKKK